MTRMFYLLFLKYEKVFLDFLFEDYVYGGYIEDMVVIYVVGKKVYKEFNPWIKILKLN